MTSVPTHAGLERAQLDALRRSEVVAAPDAAVLDLPERAVQFGTGAFLRGFLDDFLHRANEQGLFGGRVAVVSSTGSARDRAINAQDGLYTLVVEGIDRGKAVQECRIIGSVSRALAATEQWNEVLALARAPLLRYVFSNTTEVGIALDPADRFDDAPPRSFPAKLTRFLYERAREFDYAPDCGLVVIPCELIDDNGTRLRELVGTLAVRWALDPRFVSWLDSSTTFCNTLVDRIVPGAPRDEDARRLAGMLGYSDALLTTCEPYRLFAIQGDAAVKDQLSWAAADPGILVVPDVAPYRERKVRLLNGAHTLLVPVALQMGLETVRDAITEPTLNRFVRRAMFDEIVPTLDVAGAKEFAEAVLDRFENPFIRHALVDITLHATTKMRVRVVPSIVKYAARTGRPPRALTFAFAAFLLYMRGDVQVSRRAKGLPVPADEHGHALQALWGVMPRGAEPVDEERLRSLARLACGDVSLWGSDLAKLPGFCDMVAEDLVRARRDGIRAALQHALAGAAE